MSKPRLIYILFVLGVFIFNENINAQKAIEYLPNEYLVQVATNANAKSIFDKKTTYQLISKSFGIYKINSSLPLEELSKNENILAIQRNHKATYRVDETTPNDNDFSLQWDMEYIEAEKAWSVTTGGNTLNNDTIVIAVIDGGADFNHTDLKENLWYNRGEVPNDGIDNDSNGYVDDYKGWRVKQQDDAHDPHFHGTPVSGIIGAVGNNEIGVTGINWKVKVMMISGVENVDEIISAYDYIYTMRQRYNESNGAEGAYIAVTNIALGVNGGNPSDFPIWCGVYDQLGAIGILNVAATANSPIDVDIEGDVPTGCSSNYLLTVTNTDRGDTLRFSAAYGVTSIDMAAPGSGVHTLFPSNGTGTFGGTSSAAPHVAGAAGLLYSLPNQRFADYTRSSPSETVLIVKDMLMKGVDIKSTLVGKIKTSGRLNLWNSIQLLEEYFEGYQEKLELVNLYPNPSHDVLTIQYDLPELSWATVQITNTLGQIVEYIELTPTELGLKRVELDVRSYRKGIYYLTIYSDERQETRLFMVN